MRTVKVSAGGDIELQPDITVVSITMSGKALDYEQARHDAENAESQVLELLPQLGFAVEDLKTEAYSINPEIDFSSPDFPPFVRQEIDMNPLYQQKTPKTHYCFRHEFSLAFPTDHERLGRVLSVLSAALIGPELWFYYTVQDVEKAKNQALSRLVMEAEQRARCLAESAGAQLKDVQSIDHIIGECELRTNRISAQNYRHLNPSVGMNGTTVLIPGKIVFRDTVTIVWEIG